MGIIVLLSFLACYARYLSPDARLLAAMKRSDAAAIAKAIKSGARLHEAPNKWLGLLRLTPQPYRPYAPISGVATFGNTQTMKLMLDSGADPNKRDELGLAPLHYAAEKANAPMLTLLLDAGADINVTALNPRVAGSSVLLGRQPEEGMTPLMIAANRHAYQCVALLLKRGARRDLKDADGRTAWQIVNEYRQNHPRSKSASLVETQRLLK